MKRGREGFCRRSCCWTPQGVCAKRGGCACHAAGEYDERKKQAEMRHADDLLAEMARQQEVAAREGIEWTR